MVQTTRTRIRKSLKYHLKKFLSTFIPECDVSYCLTMAMMLCAFVNKNTTQNYQRETRKSDASG